MAVLLSAGGEVPFGLRQLAATVLKKLVREHWTAESPHYQVRATRCLPSTQLAGGGGLLCRPLGLPAGCCRGLQQVVRQPP